MAATAPRSRESASTSRRRGSTEPGSTSRSSGCIYLTSHELFGSSRLDLEQTRKLRELASEFGQHEIDELARLEATTRHDVKAVEYLVRARLAELGLGAVAELTHFACTSEDINNLSYALTISAAVRELWLPQVPRGHRDASRAGRSSTAAPPMLAHTHGQPATPTTVGKEFAVFVHRLERIAAQVDATEYLGKFSGATGTFAAHVAADPDRRLARDLAGVRDVARPRLEPAHHPDRIARLAGRAVLAHQPRQPRAAQPLHRHLDLHLDGLHHPDPAGGRDRVVDDAAQDQPDPVRERRGQPRDLERAARLARRDARHQRLQRDLTDSTTQRNIGVALGHSLLALDNISARTSARSRSTPRQLAADLDGNWEVLGEAIQTVIRAEVTAGRSSIADPYAMLKELTRGQRVGQADLVAFIDGLDIGADAKARLRELTPRTYTGLASDLVDYLNP